MCYHKRLLWLVCSLVSLDYVLTRTLLLDTPTPTLEEVSFLRKYGYIEEEQAGIEYAYTWASLAEPVRKMQAFAGLPQTGMLDPPTRELFKMKRCGVKDIEDDSARRRRFIIQQGWNKNTITYRVINGSSTLGKERVEQLLGRGLAVWAPHAGLRFTREDRAAADIQLSFARLDHGDGFPFDGLGQVVAHAFQPPHGEMHFDDDELWGDDGDKDEKVTDFFAVAVHEIGHALGLSHSNVRLSVMYPYYQAPVDKLHIDDIMGLQQLYMKEEVHRDVTSSEAPQGPASRSAAVPRFTRPPDDDDNEIPDLCYTNYDALQVLHDKLFVFEEEWMWVIVDKVIEPGYPRRFHEVFRGLPRHVNYVKAIYENKKKNICIFKGRKYWEFSPDFRLLRVGRLTDFGLPRDAQELTTVFLSNYNNKTYLIEYERFWRYDEDRRALDPGYPKDMSAWRDVPYPVDAAIIWKGDTFFFRGPRYWRFDNEAVRAHGYYPLPTAQVWFPCGPTPDMPRYFVNDEP